MQIPPTFAFDAETWNKCVGAPITLTRVFRQKDQAFVNILNSMRFGQMDPSTVEQFKKLSRPVNYTDGIGPTQLYSCRLNLFLTFHQDSIFRYPTRHEVDKANETRLKELPDKAHTYQSMDLPGRDSKGERISEQTMERLLERLIASKIISLKVSGKFSKICQISSKSINSSLSKIGAQVMLVKVGLIATSYFRQPCVSLTIAVTEFNTRRACQRIRRSSGRIQHVL